MQLPPELNLAQQAVVALLGTSEAERPTFDADLAPSLRRELERGLAPVVAALPEDENLFVNKHALSQVHGCEARYLAERDGDFAWSVPLARGTLAHRAIEVGVSWSGPPTPADLVAETMARAAQGTDSLGDWLRTCGDFDRADLQSQATERVSTFFECFPPLKRQWRPTLEGRVRAELFDGRIVASGKYDLSLGSANGTTAGKVIIDFKTGGFSPTHLDDLRFYALLDTLKIGTPPTGGQLLPRRRPRPPRTGRRGPARGGGGPHGRRHRPHRRAGGRGPPAARSGPGRGGQAHRPGLPVVSRPGRMRRGHRPPARRP